MLTVVNVIYNSSYHTSDSTTINYQPAIRALVIAHPGRRRGATIIIIHQVKIGHPERPADQGVDNQYYLQPQYAKPAPACCNNIMIKIRLYVCKKYIIYNKMKSTEI